MSHGVSASLTLSPLRASDGNGRPECPYVVTSPIYARCSSNFMTNDSATLIVKKWEFQGDIRDHVCIEQAVHGRGV